MAYDSDAYSVVAIGGMNPRIHHPLWYKSVGIFTEEEVSEALRAQNIVVVTNFARFNINDIVIQCIPDRWEISTTNPEKIDRIISIIQTLFDDVLPHTPVNVLGLNFDYSRQTNCPDVPKFIADSLVDVSKRLNVPTPTEGEFILRRKTEHSQQVRGTTSILMKSGQAPSVLNLSCNYNYNLSFDKSFKLSAFLPELARQNREDAELHLEHTLVALNQTGGQDDADNT